MNWSAGFFINSILLGAGLAMDAFSVSVANGMQDPDMRRPKQCQIAGTFAFFQCIMPLIGWAFVHTAVNLFSSFQRFIPWIALILLAFIGGKMLLEGFSGGLNEVKENTSLSIGTLILQGIATSIDALSVGFTIADYGFLSALVCALLIAAVTFVICIAGILIGRKFGTKFSGKASIFGGVILIAIGIEIFVTHL